MSYEIKAYLMVYSKLIKSLLIFTIVSLLFTACSQEKILTVNSNEVRKMTITINGDTFEITPETNKDLINQIYSSINSTRTRIIKNPKASNEQTSEPMFIIIIDYSNGQKDTVHSTETGKFIYRRLSGNGWIGGSNERLINILNIKAVW